MVYSDEIKLRIMAVIPILENEGLVSFAYALFKGFTYPAIFEILRDSGLCQPAPGSYKLGILAEKEYNDFIDSAELTSEQKKLIITDGSPTGVGQAWFLRKDDKNVPSFLVSDCVDRSDLPIGLIRPVIRFDDLYYPGDLIIIGNSIFIVIGDKVAISLDLHAGVIEWPRVRSYPEMKNIIDEHLQDFKNRFMNK